MNRSATVILPVFNAEHSLCRMVHELLEILPDILADFEVLIVDDGSTDHTAELAKDLSRRYPQCRVISHRQCLGLANAVQTGLNASRGEVAILHDSAPPLRATAIRELTKLGGQTENWREAGRDRLPLPNLAKHLGSRGTWHAIPAAPGRSPLSSPTHGSNEQRDTRSCVADLPHDAVYRARGLKLLLRTRHIPEVG